MQGFFRCGKTTPTYFLFSLRQGISSGAAAPYIRSLKKIKKRKKAEEKKRQAEEQARKQAEEQAKKQAEEQARSEENKKQLSL